MCAHYKLRIVYFLPHFSNLFLISSTRWKKENLTKLEFKEEIKGLLPILEETVRCLQYSPEGSFEYNVLGLARKALVNTKETLTVLSLNLI